MPAMIDCPDAGSVAAKAADIKAAGYDAVGLYFFRPGTSTFKVILTEAVARAVTAAGLWIVSIWESGEPTSADYFSTEAGNGDGHVAAALATDAGQPAGGVIYACVDYDAAESDMPAIIAYLTEFRRIIALSDYRAGVYGSGMVCKTLSELGLVAATWLAQSTGFAGYDEWRPNANIIQGPSTQVLGLDCDIDTTREGTENGGWQFTDC